MKSQNFKVNTFKNNLLFPKQQCSNPERVTITWPGQHRAG